MTCTKEQRIQALYSAKRNTTAVSHVKGWGIRNRLKLWKGLLRQALELKRQSGVLLDCHSSRLTWL